MLKFIVAVAWSEEWKIDGEPAKAFSRALRSVDAELLASDVQNGGGPQNGGRTDDQRRADALVALILPTAKALGAEPT